MSGAATAMTEFNPDSLEFGARRGHRLDSRITNDLVSKREENYVATNA